MACVARLCHQEYLIHCSTTVDVFGGSTTTLVCGIYESASDTHQEDGKGEVRDNQDIWKLQFPDHHAWNGNISISRVTQGKDILELCVSGKYDNVCLHVKQTRHSVSLVSSQYQD